MWRNWNTTALTGTCSGMAALGNSLMLSLKVQQGCTTQLSNSTPGIYHREMKTYSPTETRVCSSSIRNHQQLETTHTAFGDRMDKQAVTRSPGNYCAPVKRSGLLTHTVTWRNLKGIFCSMTGASLKRFYALSFCIWLTEDATGTQLLSASQSPSTGAGTHPSAEAGLEEKMAAKQPPPLMKKHSQTDLVSRLKTRKILGVGGEDDDGEVHRSKISQVLGNEIKFTVREPLGLRVWQFVSAVLFSGIAIMALAFPDQLYDAVFDGAQVTSKTPIRLYGGALLSISLIMWNALYTAEKVIIRWTLLTEACYFGVQFLVVTATLAETGLMSLGILLLLVSRLLFVVISIYYYYQVGRRPKKA
nr:tumor protein p53-inducible protein 11 isoform X2 [Symphalangus syndactylus]